MNNSSFEIKEAIFKGDFWKPCPGTGGGYLCCGYQIITPMIGCGMHCRYCVLQVYFEDQRQIIFRNFEDLKKEVREKLKGRSDIIRFGTGEFTDSLFLEEEKGFSRKIATLLEPYSNVVVEFKTKSNVVKPLKSIKKKHKVIIGFSLNTPRMISLMEKGTSPLEGRLKAAKECLEMGFFVAFHFDPIFYYDRWEEEYKEVVDAIYSYITDKSRIAWCSLGGFRSNPALKQYLKEKGEHLPLFSGEMIYGADGKLRYFRPIRVNFYKAMQKFFYSHHNDAPLYLCMESKEVWSECGLIKKIPYGLPAYLDERAKYMLLSEGD